MSVELKTRAQMRLMRRASLVVADIQDALRAACAPGVSTAELEDVSAGVIRAAGAHSNFLGYGGFPATVCISVNSTVVHGIPGPARLRDGDLVSFDCGAYVVAEGSQWHGDSAFSMICGEEGAASRKRRDLNAQTEEAMWAGVAALATHRRLSCVGEAVERTVARWERRTGWEAGIIEDYCGHGIGTRMHQDPDVLNYRVLGISPRLRPGMVLCVEPMLVGGDIATTERDHGWTVVTDDGEDGAHWEHEVALLPEGIAVLTARDWGERGLAPFGVRPVALE